MTWYLVRTAPKSEKKAAAWLRRAGLRVYLPKATSEKLHHRSKEPIVSRKPLWHGLLLVRFPEALTTRGQPRFGIIRDVIGVADYLKWSTSRGREPVPVADDVVGDHMRRQRRKLYDGAALAKAERAERRARLRKDASVKITDGPFKSFLGLIDRVDDDTVVVLIDLFGRAVPVSADVGQVAVVDIVREKRALASAALARIGKAA
jgi:transcription antitermination factor NusG